MASTIVNKKNCGQRYTSSNQQFKKQFLKPFTKMKTTKNISAAFVATMTILLMGGIYASCSNDEEENPYETLADPLMTRSGELPSGSSSSSSSYSITGTIDVSSTTLKASANIPYIIEWTQSISYPFSSAQVSSKSIRVDENKLYQSLADSVSVSVTLSLNYLHLKDNDGNADYSIHVNGSISVERKGSDKFTFDVTKK